QREEKALWEGDDDPAGFQWIQPDAAQANVYAFIRRKKPVTASGAAVTGPGTATAPSPGEDDGHLVVVANLSPVVKRDYAIGVPHLGHYREVLNTDAGEFGGSGVMNASLTSSAEKRD